MFRLIALFTFVFFAQPGDAQSCSEIKFARGAYSGEVAGRVTDGQPLCFTFGSGAGQTARIELFGSDNACFTVLDVVDCQADFSFRTARRSYTVQLFQLTRRAGWEQVTLRLTIR